MKKLPSPKKSMAFRLPMVKPESKDSSTTSLSANASDLNGESLFSGNPGPSLDLMSGPTMSFVVDGNRAGLPM